MDSPVVTKLDNYEEQLLKKAVGRLETNCWLTILLQTVCFRKHLITCRQPDGSRSVAGRQPVGSLSVICWPTFHRQSFSGALHNYSKLGAFRSSLMTADSSIWEFSGIFLPEKFVLIQTLTVRLGRLRGCDSS